MQKKKFVLSEGVMKVDFDPHMWDLAEKGVLPKIEVSATVKLNTGDDARMNLYIEGAGVVETEEENLFNSRFGRPPVKGENYWSQAFPRIMYEMLHFVTFGSKNWVLRGHVTAGGGSNKVPILVLYSETMRRAFYSMKRDTDTDSPSSTGDADRKNGRWWLN